MNITHLGHSCVLIETENLRILIDPGNFSTAWHDVVDLNVILVTHKHPDHIDPVHIYPLIANNPDAQFLVEPSIVEALDLPTAQKLVANSKTWIQGTLIEAVGGLHAIIHNEIPRIGNVGVVLRTEGEPSLFHPGDAIDMAPPDIDILAVPAHAPWCAMKETIDFVRAVNANQGFLIHDGLINERGWTLTYNRLTEMTTTALTDLRDGQPVIL
ncbi:MAG: MBL fold metallo-hydrolase [Propionibacteriaceae bacterium]|nr:MBL fold metallo-hydrolase [Propionibacteriaceae bacterium]